MNFGYLAEFRDYLIGLGLKEWRLFTIFPVGRAAEDPNLQLSDVDFYRLMEFIRDTNREGRIAASYGCEGFLGGFEGEVRPHPYTCYAGVEVASILCDGTISACPSIRFDYKQGNVREDDFWTVWQNRSSPIAIGVGLAEISVLIASCGVTARGMECTCTTTRASSSSAIISDFCAPKHH